MRRFPPLGVIPAAKGTHIMQIGLFNLLSKRDPDKPTREVYGEMRDQVRLAEDAGFDPASCTTRRPSSAWREAAEHMRFIRRIVAAMRGGYVRLDGAWLREQPAQGEPSLEEIMSTTYIGSAGEVAERMIEQTEALRPTHLSCFMAIGGLSGNRVMRTIERFAAQVLPQVAGHFGGLDRIGAGTTEVASAAT